ncbi:uncharacterized protein EDB91DRAFT_1087807 [Suillus paluster]|uniref:uncharacterized protein n=1 Tax=Suillus paluster TaxID=48578 RepID=UPI001B87F044|nr:uncharacterized protein EDB91DRAFT_1087807 [Suillus paluster]KAG1723408.1 hypothetical protein EDB91DRAFT_1087807 [Suillus paluster]
MKDATVPELLDVAPAATACSRDEANAGLGEVVVVGAISGGGVRGNKGLPRAYGHLLGASTEAFFSLKCDGVSGKQCTLIDLYHYSQSSSSSEITETTSSDETSSSKSDTKTRHKQSAKKRRKRTKEQSKERRNNRKNGGTIKKNPENQEQAG